MTSTGEENRSNQYLSYKTKREKGEKKSLTQAVGRTGWDPIDNNRELTECFRKLQAPYNLKKNIQCTNTPNDTKSMVYKHTKHTEINKHFHTKHGKNTQTHTRLRTHACKHARTHIHTHMEDCIHTMTNKECTGSHKHC